MCVDDEKANMARALNDGDTWCSQSRLKCPRDDCDIWCGQKRFDVGVTIVIPCCSQPRLSGPRMLGLCEYCDLHHQKNTSGASSIFDLTLLCFGKRLISQYIIYNMYMFLKVLSWPFFWVVGDTDFPPWPNNYCRERA